MVRGGGCVRVAERGGAGAARGVCEEGARGCVRHQHTLWS